MRASRNWSTGETNGTKRNLRTAGPVPLLTERFHVGNIRVGGRRPDLVRGRPGLTKGQLDLVISQGEAFF